jgi:hypothetical protein
MLPMWKFRGTATDTGYTQHTDAVLNSFHKVLTKFSTSM